LLPEVKDETKIWSPQKLYTEAKQELADANYEKAIKHFETLEARYPYGAYAQQAQLEVAYAYYKSNEPVSAIAACDRFIKLHPNHPNVDYAYYLKGLANFNDELGFLGKLTRQDVSERDPKSAQESYDALRELVTRLPNSKYAPDALARMKYLVNMLAAHEVNVARFYMKRKAYVAVVNRAQYVVEHYSQTPAREEALELMAEAYERMGLKDLRDDTVRVLKLNFPNNRYKTGTLGEPPWWKGLWPL